MKVTALFSIILLTLSAFGQEDYVNTKKLEFRNLEYEDKINSVRLFRQGDELSMPVIRLGTNDQLTLLFDDFNTEVSDYVVSFIHCTPDWKSTGLDYLEYINGIDNQYILDYDYSGPTKQRYVQYRFNFPNEDAQFRFSGNYLLLVYRNENRSDLILSRRFMVAENRIGAQVQIRNATKAEDYRRRQEVDFVLYTKGYDLTNIYENLDVQLMQNGRWDNRITGLKPLFIKEDELDFDYDGENTFEGGNEYRLFDTRLSTLSGQMVGRSFVRNDTNIVFLQMGERRNIKAYRDAPDLNGRVVNDVFDDRYDSSTDMDYHLVYFSLSQPYEIPNGKVYLIGEFTGNEIQDKYQMSYDPEKQIYFGTAYLKQGYYNYLWVFVPDGEEGGLQQKLEGTHASTENMYSLLVYHKNIHEDHHRLIFFKNYRINF
jgi:hypothetical protein